MVGTKKTRAQLVASLKVYCITSQRCLTPLCHDYQSEDDGDHHLEDDVAPITFVRCIQTTCGSL